MSNDLTPPRHFLRPGFRTFGAVLSVALLFMSTPAPGATKVGTATKVVKDVYGTSLNRRMKPGEALVFNQKVRTGSESVANLSFLDDSTLVVGPRAEITLDEFVFDPEANIVRGSFKVVRGLMRFASGTTKLDISVKTPVVIIGIRGTAFDFLVTKGETEIVVREGTVEVTSRDGTDTLNEGEVMSVSRREGAVRKRAISKQMNVELTHTFKLLGTTSKQHLVEWLAERRKAKTEEQPVQKASVSATADQEVTQNEKENLLFCNGRSIVNPS